MVVGRVVTYKVLVNMVVVAADSVRDLYGSTNTEPVNVQ